MKKEGDVLNVVKWQEPGHSSEAKPTELHALTIVD